MKRDITLELRDYIPLQDRYGIIIPDEEGPYILQQQCRGLWCYQAKVQGHFFLDPYSTADSLLYEYEGEDINEENVEEIYEKYQSVITKFVEELNETSMVEYTLLTFEEFKDSYKNWCSFFGEAWIPLKIKAINGSSILKEFMNIPVVVTWQNSD